MKIKKIVVELAGADLTDAVINNIIKSIKDTVIKKCNGKNIGYEINEEKSEEIEKSEELEKILEELKKYPYSPSPEYPYINKGPFVPNPNLPNNPIPLPLQPGDDPNIPQWWATNTTPIGKE